MAVRVAVVGSGVLGLTAALRLAQAGARVTLYEAAPGRPSASSVAAGMIAPASEAWLEPPLRPLAAALLAARHAWNALAAEIGAPLHAHGARHLGAPADLAARAAAMRACGFEARFDGDALLTPQDALVDPAVALPALAQALVGAGGAAATGTVRAEGDGFAVDGAPLAADRLVFAGGAPGRTGALAPELAALRPIKGQLLRFTVAEPPGPVWRSADVYLASQGGALVAGATMEPGRDDLAPDPRQVAALRAAAVRLRPDLASAPFQAHVGVRVEGPDGLPLVGPSRHPGVVLATGARRNGWLLAPLVADMVTAQVLGRALGALEPLAQAFDPGRVGACVWRPPCTRPSG